MRLDKPIGIYLLLWPTLWALWFAANGRPPFHILIIFILGVFIMRPAGCIINDFFDKEFDAKVSRTQDRPLAKQLISSYDALLLFCILVTISFLLVIQLNWLTVFVAFIALILSALYPLMKRVTYLPQLVLGAAWYLSVIMAFTAVIGTVPFIAWLLYVTVIIWTVIFDTMYAMADRSDDIQIGVKSTAILFASYDRLIIGILQLGFLALLCVTGMMAKLSIVYYVSVACSALFMIYQQKLIYARKPTACIKAFKNNHWIGLIIFLGIICSFW